MPVCASAVRVSVVLVCVCVCVVHCRVGNKLRGRDGLSVESQENPPKCSPANNEAGFDGTPLFMILVLGI